MTGAEADRLRLALAKVDAEGSDRKGLSEAYALASEAVPSHFWATARLLLEQHDELERLRGLLEKGAHHDDAG